MPDDNIENTKSRQYEKLLKKRENAVRALTFHVEKVDALTDDKIIEAHTRMSALEAAYDKFKGINEQIEDEDEFDVSDFNEKTEDVVDKFITMIAKLRIITKESYEPSMLNSTISNRTHQEIHT